MKNLLQQINREIGATSCYIDLNCCYDCRERYAHLDTLKDIAQRHVQWTELGDDAPCRFCEWSWPCPEAVTVIEALARMKARS